jgi:hypothetical protein
MRLTRKKVWCREGDLNPHWLPNRILSFVSMESKQVAPAGRNGR